MSLCRDELLTSCKEATKISAVPWCFTEFNNKRRACTDEVGAVRPFTWFLKDNQVRSHHHLVLLTCSQHSSVQQDAACSLIQSFA